MSIGRRLTAALAVVTRLALVRSGSVHDEFDDRIARVGDPANTRQVPS